MRIPFLRRSSCPCGLTPYKVRVISETCPREPVLDLIEAAEPLATRVCQCWSMSVRVL
jgi:SUMO ligase MMS21 Smc5/6 complex component